MIIVPKLAVKVHVAPEHVVPMVPVTPRDVVVKDAPTARLVVVMGVNQWSVQCATSVKLVIRPIPIFVVSV